MGIDQETGSSPDMTEQQAQGQQPVNSHGETEESLLSVLQSAVAETAGEGADGEAVSPPAEGVEAVTEQSEGESKAQSAEEDEPLEGLPQKTQRRIQKLLAERAEWRTRASEFEPDAKQYREIQTFMQQAQLSPDEVAEGLILMAEMKSGDPAKAYERLQQKMETLALAAGKKLPPDLQERVEQGYVDPETAQSLWQRQMESERKAAMAARELEMRQQRETVASQQAIRNAVVTWEQTAKQSDPDFDVKADLIRDRVKAHVLTHGSPRDADAALSIAKQAYDEVTQTLNRIRGNRTAMRPAVGGKANGAASPEPRNLLDVIRQAAG